ncbi:MAG TPA: sugar phosphate isomerase/epimerase [Luteitalea sp.]|nr:sugar phosphate isomerase/epimerase [Luteitalea sp.]
MKLGVFTALFGGLSLDQVIDKVSAAGLEAVELGTGAYPGASHIDVDGLLSSKAKAKAYKQKLADAGLIISALSCHGNPLHPDKAFAKDHDEVFRKSVRLAELLGVETVITFSGCPGDSDASKWPNWVTCPWPPDYLKVLEWQWEKKVIPYWTRAGKFAKDHGVRVALEAHPGFVVYSVETALKLREAVGPQIGVNFDPSHLFWQGVDVPAAIRALGDSIFHFHAKDVALDRDNVRLNGVLDPKSYADMANRSWLFRTVGWGHGASDWAEIMSALRMVGYDHVVSIEHEDALASVDEGLANAVRFLRPLILKEQPAEAWWV